MAANRRSMRQPVWFGLLCVLALTLPGCPRGRPANTPTGLSCEKLTAPGADPEAENLPPEEEINALLAGDPDTGRCSGVARVAVLPVRVAGKTDQDWLGEAVAEVVAARLSQSSGTSVLERGEVRQLVTAMNKSRDEANDAVIGAGKLLQAKLIVTGKLFPSGGTSYRGTMRAIDTSTGVWVGAENFEMSESNWPTAVAAAASMLAGKLGKRSASAIVPPALGAAQLDLAGKAQQLQHAGSLVEAAATYGKALPRPSGAWRYEAEYLKVMNDLGMEDWVRQRADKVLSLMPVQQGTACERARILTQRHRRDAKGAVAGMRQAVRVAASCGDPSVVVAALVIYAQRMSTVHVPTAVAALDAAEALVGTAGAYAACELAFERTYFDSSLLNRAKDLASRWRSVSDQCKGAGSLRSAAIASGNAAVWTVSGKQKLESLRQSAELIAKVGGKEQDRTAANLAAELRGQGRLGESDKLLQEAMGVRLRAIVDLHGGLPDPAARLDADLLAACGIPKVVPPSRSLGDGDALVGKAHNALLAVLVREWAKRTSKHSVPQANVYEEIADRLAGEQTDASDSGDPDAGFKARLAKARAEYAFLQSVTAAPLRGRAPELMSALYALVDWYWAAAARGSAGVAQRAELAKLASKLANWTELPRGRVHALAVQANEATLAGKTEMALQTIASAKTTVQEEPRLASYLVDREITALTARGKQATLALRRQQVPLAQADSERAWVDKLYNLGWYAVGADAQAVEEAHRGLRTAADKLAGDGSYEEAAHALERIAQLQNAQQHAQGTPEALSAHMERAKVLDRLNDPVRSLEARADVLYARMDLYVFSSGGMARRQFDEDPTTTSLLAYIERRAGELAAQGRYRDAARLVSRLPYNSSKARSVVASAIQWAEHFQDSAEHPNLVGALYALQATATDSKKEAKQLRQKSSDAYLRGNDFGAAAFQLEGALRMSDNADDLRASLSQCKKVLAEQPDYLWECARGAGRYLESGAAADAAVARQVHGELVRHLPDVTRRQSAKARFEYVGLIAVSAARAGDLDAARKAVGELRAYYTKTAPNAYEWVIRLSSVAIGVSGDNPGFATELYLEFDKAGGASDFWKATSYASYARVAQRAGNAEAERRFLDVGRALASRYPRAQQSYDIYPAKAAIDKKDWRALEKTYDEVAQGMKRHYPAYDLIQIDYDWLRALTRVLRKDYAGASKQLQPHVTRAEAAAEKRATTRLPCRDAVILEQAAAIAMARGRCKDGDALRATAEKLRSQCDKDRCYDAPNGATWCDRVSSKTYRGTNKCNTPVKDVEKELSY